MTKQIILERILEDIRTDSVKSVILDSDMANEMDDQYALAYCIGSDKIKLLSVNSAPFRGDRGRTYPQGQEESYQECLHIRDLCLMDESSLAIWRGAEAPLTEQNGFAPMDSPASRNIIKTVKESHKLVYVLTIGCCTNVVSAYLMDPSIAENMCVIWLGGNELSYDDCHEYNLYVDYRAGQILINSNIPLILMPAESHRRSLGTQVLKASFDWLNTIAGTKPIHDYLRHGLPYAFYNNRIRNQQKWRHILWDVAAPGLLAVPDAFDLSIITAPIFGDDHRYAFDQTRDKIIYMNKLDKTAVFDDCAKAISAI